MVEEARDNGSSGGIYVVQYWWIRRCGMTTEGNYFGGISIDARWWILKSRCWYIMTDGDWNVAYLRQFWQWQVYKLLTVDNDDGSGDAG